MGAIQRLPKELAAWHLELRSASFYVGVPGWTAWTEGEGPEPGLVLHARQGELLLRGEAQRAEFAQVLDHVVSNLVTAQDHDLAAMSVWTVTRNGEELAIGGPVHVYGPDKELPRRRSVIELPYPGIAELAAQVRRAA